jgi:hypothetical protein
VPNTLPRYLERTGKITLALQLLSTSAMAILSYANGQDYEDSEIVSVVGCGGVFGSVASSAAGVAAAIAT